MGNSVGGTAQSPTDMARTHDENRKLIIASQDQYFKQWLENKENDEDEKGQWYISVNACFGDIYPINFTDKTIDMKSEDTKKAK